MRSLINHSIQWARQRLGMKPLAQSVPELEQWLSGALGRAILAEEQQQIDSALSHLYGFHLLQMSISSQIDLSNASTIQHRFSLNPVASRVSNGGSRGSQTQAGGGLSRGLAEVEKIPLDRESVDVVLMHHVLEFTENPHQLLRETARIVIPKGYVVIVGFNPFSWFGVFKPFARIFSRSTHWRHHSLRLGRVIDWLRLLDFEPLSIDRGFCRWPIDHSKFIEKTQWAETLARKMRLPIGGFYVVVARKDVVGMTPIKPSWKKINPIETLVGVRPTTRVRESSTVKKQKQLH
ncbi:class I SAM-dependent methyltransferase [Aurantivibrio plasticivorans]